MSTQNQDKTDELKERSSVPASDCWDLSKLFNDEDEWEARA